MITDKIAANAATFVVDGGNLYWRGAVLPEPMKAGQTVRANTLAKGTALLPIDAMGLGPSDLQLGWDLVRSLATANNLPYVAANLDCGGQKPFPAYRIVERGGVRLGFVGALPAETKVDGCEVSDPVEAIAGIMGDLKKADAVIALGAWSYDTSKLLVERVPEISFIVSAVDAGSTDAKPVGADHWILSSGSQGKKVGMLEATLLPSGKGWISSGPQKSVQERKDRFTKRLEESKKKAEDPNIDDVARKRALQQVEFYQQEVSKADAELAASSEVREVPANTFVTSEVPLSRDLVDHAETLAIVTPAHAELESMGALDKGHGGITLPTSPMIPPNIRERMRSADMEGRSLKPAERAPSLKPQE